LVLRSDYRDKGVFVRFRPLQVGCTTKSRPLAVFDAAAVQVIFQSGLLAKVRLAG
jgi:hypothetical protein